MILIPVTWSSSCSFPTTWAWPRETETLPLPPSLCRCPVLFLESPGPWGPDLPHPLTPQLRFYDSICLEFSTLPAIYPQQTYLPSSTSVMGCDYPCPSQASAPRMRPSLLSRGDPPGIPSIAWIGGNSGCGPAASSLSPPYCTTPGGTIHRAGNTM